MPINAGYEYFEAEKKYLAAESLDDKIFYLEELIRKAPRHKGSENLLAELKLRLKKFKEKKEKNSKVGKGGKKGIRKEGFMVALVGKTNSGKSCLLRAITNAEPKISETEFTTTEAEVGMMDYYGVQAQIVDLPSTGNKEFDYSVVNVADLVLEVVEQIDDLKEISKYLEKVRGKKLVVFNKVDRLSEGERRKLEQRIRANRIKEYVIVSCLNGDGLEDLKREIFLRMGVIRVFTKEPGKEKSPKPFVLKEGSSVYDLAEGIYKGFSSKVKEARLTGPSGKFSNQKVGLKHILKDMDIVEFKSG